MSGTYADGLEAAACWHDKMAGVYAFDLQAMRAALEADDTREIESRDEARIDKYEALAMEHRASAKSIREIGSGAGAAADWIEWSGGERPVSPETLVLVKFRTSASMRTPCRADCVLWGHRAGASDIIAYRVVSA